MAAAAPPPAGGNMTTRGSAANAGGAKPPAEARVGGAANAGGATDEGCWASCTEGLTADYVTREVLNGLTIGFAQIPESVAFAFLANIKPPIALHAAWIVGGICSIFGGRKGMVNGATGAFAAIIATFLPKPDKTGENGEGVELLFPSVMLAGVLMLIFAALKLHRFILLLPSPVMIGFCNGLAIVIGKAQLHPFKDPDTHEYKTGMEMVWMILIAVSSMLVMEYMGKLKECPYTCCKIFKVIPSSFMAIIWSIIMEFCIVRNAGSKTDTIGDVSEFTDATRFPIPFMVSHNSTDYDLGKITEGGAAGKIILQGVLLCVVGTIESLMTSEVVESFVKTPSDGQRTVVAMGFGNIISGFLGGMGGNAMIGLSTINVLNGGTGRMAPTVTAAVVMIATVVAYPLLNYIPVSALTGIMLVVVLHTFKWFSIPIVIAAILPESWRQSCSCKHFDLTKKIPRLEAFVIVGVTVLAVMTNIAYAVIAGVAVCALMFTWSAAIDGQTFVVTPSFEGGRDGTKIYTITGHLYFVSANRLLKKLNPDNDPDSVEVHFANSTVMDYTAMETMHKVHEAYTNKNKKIRFFGVNPSSYALIRKSQALHGSWVTQEITQSASELPVEAVQPAYMPTPGDHHGVSSTGGVGGVGRVASDTLRRRRVEDAEAMHAVAPQPQTAQPVESGDDLGTCHEEELK